LGGDIPVRGFGPPHFFKGEKDVDLKAYFKKVAEIAETLVEGDQLVVSQETSDGGKAGVMTEVTKAIASRLIAEGKARLATEVEKSQWLAELEEKRKHFEQAVLAKTVHLQVVRELENLVGKKDRK
jgi:hypothetical protein